MGRHDLSFEEPVDNALVSFEEELITEEASAPAEFMEFSEIELDPYAFF
ncbi:MAG TPA: hypothetical protein VLA04_03425 [Verrucomicrobiae bacterium]|nr:hypothetical protein [Verrucomicrobiae bacterium]